MSEAEKRKRLSYKRKRKKCIYIQIIALAVITALMLAFTITYNQLNKEYYIDYTEHGEIDYMVQLKPNDFYEQEWLGKDMSYVASLIESVLAELSYEMNMDAENVDYKYSYSVDALLKILDNDTQKAILEKLYPLKAEQEFTQSSNNKLVIEESVLLDYEIFNNLSQSFIDTMKLSDTTSLLIVSLKVNVIGSSDEFEDDTENNYVVSLNIPLTTSVVDINMSSSVNESESKVLANAQGVNQNVFKVLAIILLIVDVLLAAFLIFYIYYTRNEDINYSIRVKRIFGAYKSYIQKITNDFDESGYKVLLLDSFTDMLTIRDTILSPILMHENKDQTMTRFFIPTSTSILYVYEIKVENYDELYGIGAENNAPIEPKAELVSADSVISAAPAVSEAEINETPVSEPSQTSERVVEEIPVTEAAPQKKKTKFKRRIFLLLHKEKSHKSSKKFSFKRANEEETKALLEKMNLKETDIELE